MTKTDWDLGLKYVQQDSSQASAFKALQPNHLHTESATNNVAKQCVFIETVCSGDTTGNVVYKARRQSRSCPTVLA